jgi:aspartate-semialdehyde dehydrogenase
LKAGIAIVGATGAVGRELLAVLVDRGHGPGDLRLFASERSVGRKLESASRSYDVQMLAGKCFTGLDWVFFSAGAAVSRQWARQAVAAGALVIDNSSAFRLEPDVPLVVPEVNGRTVAEHHWLIANPNCVAALLTLAIWPLHQLSPLIRLVVSTYQSVSGAGRRAMLELEQQSADHLAGRPIKPQALPHPIAFNLFSHTSEVDETGYNAEERKVIAETRKVLALPELPISITCIRVPVLRAHSLSITATFDRPISEEAARDAIRQAPGLRLVDDRSANHFPMPSECSGRDEVLVGRIRRDLGQPDGRGLQLFVCGDQLRKGAALNAVQIAELVGVRRPAAV